MVIYMTAIISYETAIASRISHIKNLIKGGIDNVSEFLKGEQIFRKKKKEKNTSVLELHMQKAADEIKQRHCEGCENDMGLKCQGCCYSTALWALS